MEQHIPFQKQKLISKQTLRIAFLFFFVSSFFINTSLLFGNGGDTYNSTKLKEGYEAPDFNVTTLSGKNISYYKDLRGKKAVILYFWATWAGVSRRDLFYANELYKESSNKIEVIGIILVGEQERAKESIEKYNVEFNNAYDKDNKMTTLYEIEGLLPAVVYIHKNGKIVHHKLGLSIDDLVNDNPASKKNGKETIR